MKLMRLTLRVLIGVLFVGHGTQKLFGWFGGHGPEGTGGFFESMGIRPGRAHATMAGLGGVGGGVLPAPRPPPPPAAAGLRPAVLGAPPPPPPGEGPGDAHRGLG